MASVVATALIQIRTIRASLVLGMSDQCHHGVPDKKRRILQIGSPKQCHTDCLPSVCTATRTMRGSKHQTFLQIATARNYSQDYIYCMLLL